MAEIHDLRSFIEVLEAAGQLVRIRRKVSLQHELATVAAALERQGGPAPLFESVAETSWPIFASSVANQERAALALGCEKSQVTEAMQRAIDPANAIHPVQVEEAAWKANVVTGDDLDVHMLPIPVHAQMDGGPFITSGITLSKDPTTGRGNCSYNRMQLKGPREFGIMMNEWRHIRQFMDAQEAKDASLPVAIAIGVDPAIKIATGVRYDDDELCIAGAIRGEPVKVCRGVTVNVNIPAEAEIVVEGYLPPHVREDEGPLAEFHGFYGKPWESPVFHVTAICWRDNPIFETIIPGWNEHVYLGNVLPREPLLLNFVRHVSKQVTSLHILPYSGGFTAVVALRKSNPGEPRNVALAAFAAHMNIKWCIVVDPDVDIFNPADVMWALSTRVDWSHDIFLVPGAQGHELDPTSDVRGVQTKIGIDATGDKGRRTIGARVVYPDVDLSKYLAA
jgi:2,5-furandicarboxylate decarboxylase 1